MIFENFFGHVGFKCGVFLDMRFWSWKIFGHVILGHGKFLSCESFSFLFFVMGNDELKFCVAEPQELRQSPNVEKCMGSIVS